MKTMFELDTGEKLKCRVCREKATIWGSGEIGVGCFNCRERVMGQKARDMIHDQALYFEARRYKDQVKRAGSAEGIPIPASVEKRRDQLMPGGRESYPMRTKLSDPHWPFYF